MSETITIKTEEEIQLMREAGKILAQVHETLANEIHEGMSTYEVDRLGEEVIRSFGCEPNFKGLYGYPGSVCVSVNDEVVHGIPSKDRILVNLNALFCNICICSLKYNISLILLLSFFHFELKLLYVLKNFFVLNIFLLFLVLTLSLLLLILIKLLFII